MKTRFVIASLTTLALVGTAAADGEPAAPDAAGGGGGDAAGGAPAMGTPPAAPADAAPASRWPRSVIDRPLTLPKGLLLAGPDLLIVKIPSVTVAGVTVGGGTGELADIGVGYGVTDDLEINTITPTYTIPLHPGGSAKGPFDVGAGYKLLRGAAGGKLELIARVVAGYDINASAARPIRLGVHVQYNVTPKFAVFSHDTGNGNLGLSIAVDGDPKPVFLTIPVGAGFQATKELWVEADTTLANIKVSNSVNTSIADATPLALTGVFNAMDGHLDVLGYVGFGDLQHAGDTVFFGVGARYYLGTL